MFMYFGTASAKSCYGLPLDAFPVHRILELSDGRLVHVVGGVVDGVLHQVRVPQVLRELPPVTHLGMSIVQRKAVRNDLVRIWRIWILLSRSFRNGSGFYPKTEPSKL